MKKQKVTKLGLNKMTVANLAAEKMEEARGGKERCAYSVVIQSCHETDFTCSYIICPTKYTICNEG